MQRTDKKDMKIFIILVLFNMNSATAFFGIDEELEVVDEAPLQDKSQHQKFLKTYCIAAKGSVTGEPKYSSPESFTCELGRKPQFFYESWKGQKIKSNTKRLDPQVSQAEREYFETSYLIYLAKQNKDEHFQKCLDESKITPNKICKELEKYKQEPNFEYKMITAINLHGQVAYIADNLPKPDQTTKKEGNETQAPISEVKTATIVEKQEPTKLVVSESLGTQTVQTKEVSKEAAVAQVEVAATPTVQQAATGEVLASTLPTTTPNTTVNDSDINCDEKLKLAIASLLEQDTKNIIGLQYELTVLKMASATSGANVKSFEELIKKKSKDIASIDDGILNKMNKTYKDHGLPEDAAAITTHLKQKASNANYYAKDKRFFNQDSSAFLLAYQNLTPDSGINDTDVSVLWFMDKVSERAKNDYKKYQEEHNLTNLSTRIAQYTGAISPGKAISKKTLDAMVIKQQSKIDAEFSVLIQNFKTSNINCYKKIFGESEGDNECNDINVVNKVFAQLLAVNSKIDSIKLVSLDAQLKGGLDKTRFKIARYVDTPAAPVKTAQTVEAKTLVDDSKLIETKINEAHLGPDDTVPN